MYIEKSFVIIKPDGLIIRNLILEHFRSQGLYYQETGEIVFREELIRKFYHFLPETTIQKCIAYLDGQRLPTYVVSGENAIKTVKMIKNLLRKTYGNNRTGSIMHSTNTRDEFDGEICKMEINFNSP